MNYYTEDFWQAEMLNPSLYNTVIDNIDNEQCVIGGGLKTSWKLHMMGLKDVNMLINFIDACLPHAAMHVSGGATTDDYGASIFDERGFRIVETWGIHLTRENM